jgi:hypothetical protein
VWYDEIGLADRDGPMGRFTHRLAICAQKRREKVIETVILLNHNNNVPDGASGRSDRVRQTHRRNAAYLTVTPFKAPEGFQRRDKPGPLVESASERRH